MCPTLCDPMDCSTPGFPVLHHLPEFAQTHVHWIGDAIQPSHPAAVPFSSGLQSVPSSGFFPISQLFTTGGQSVGVSASALVLPMSTQGWFPFRLNQCVYIYIYIYIYIYMHVCMCVCMCIIYIYNWFIWLWNLENPKSSVKAGRWETQESTQCKWSLEGCLLPGVSNFEKSQVILIWARIGSYHSRCISVCL